MIKRICAPAGIALCLVLSIMGGNATAKGYENEKTVSDIQEIVENMTIDEKSRSNAHAGFS
ncbi:hypothetical protein RCO48_34325 [Peribacillus frigoritolerans]|nr:hypothetical protein [Peribacillus frigoritolerans]